MYSLSRSRIALYIECPCCFYKSVKWNIKRPDSLPFTLNNAVDTLLKKEFDQYRVLKQPHPIVSDKGMGYIPLDIPTLNDWRNPKRGIRFKHPELDMELYGAIDDVWINEAGQLVVVDYKATAKQEMVTELNNIFHIHYKRQMEFYQWLLAMNGYEVDPIGFFVYCTGKTKENGLNGALKFDINLIPYTGSWEWIDPVLRQVNEILEADISPDPRSECSYCRYINESNKATIVRDRLL